LCPPAPGRTSPTGRRRRRPRPTVLWLLAFAAAVASPAQAEPQTIDQLLREARRLRDLSQAEQPQAIAVCQSIIDGKRATDSEFKQAYEIAADCYRRLEDYPKAISMAERMRLAFPKEADVDWKSMYLQFDYYKRLKQKHEVMIDKLRAFLKRHPDDGELRAEAHLRIGELLMILERFKEAYAEGEAALKLGRANPNQRHSAFWQMQEAAYRDKDMEKRAEVLRVSVEPQNLAGSSYWHVSARRRYYVDTLLSLKRHEEAQRYLLDLEPQEENPDDGQPYCLYLARSYYAEEKWDKALEACEWAFTHHPTKNCVWRDAQRQIADALAKQGRFDEALQAARVLYDASRNHGEVTSYASFIVHLLRTADGNDERSNAFVLHQLYGSAGEDGMPGTEDDPADVLTPIPYPTYPQREKAFDVVRKAAGDNAGDLEHCAWTYLYAGRPQEALRYLAEAFRRYNPDRLWQIAEYLAFAGPRSVRGNGLGLELLPAYIAFGPEGPDGQPGTEDDLAEPKGLTEAAGTEVVVISPDQLAMLDELVEKLKRLAERTAEYRSRREYATDSLRRIYEAAPRRNWAGMQEWATALLLAETDDNLRTSAGFLALKLAQGQQLHLGGVHRFFRELDAAAEAAGKPLPGRLTRLRDDLRKRCENLAGTSCVPKLQPPKKPTK
jgi:tetratricopeptide (TPR) repeat protein